MKIVRFFYLILVILGCALVFPPASMASEQDPPQKGALTVAEEKWGIRILSLRPTAAGHMLDLRYRVTDPVKARDILDKRQKAYIVDQKSGKALPVPVTTAGPLRQTTLQPEAGRIYFVLFSNPAGLVKEGSNVTVILGDFRAEDLIAGAAGVQPQADNRQLPEMTESQRKKWDKVEKVQGTLRREYGICVEHCGNDTGCLDRCKKAFETRLDREYQRLLQENE